MVHIYQKQGNENKNEENSKYRWKHRINNQEERLLENETLIRTLVSVDIEEVDAGSLSCHEFVLKLGMNCCIKWSPRGQHVSKETIY